jgi:Ni/Fe-hydrogenase 1 B-type cytochrome subunit
MEKIVTTYVWEWPVRVTHWVNFIAIIILSITGIYIGSPRSLGMSPSDYFMGWTRFVHFLFGYIFVISVVSRIYWAFVGNEYANWRTFFPYLNDPGRRNMKDTFLFYTFFRKDAPHVVGHNALAAAAYFVIFLLYLVMIFTGFALYSEYAPGSVMSWLFGWMFLLFSNQGLRLTHHIVMWLLIAFAIHHIYSAWLVDILERNGEMSGIFGGYKSVTIRSKD